jgi:FMN-dependent NADH-azoreductase
MYNFSIPSQLKGWIDRVCVAGRTFQYGANGPEGLLPKGKKVFIASTRGGVYTGNSPAAVLEHHESYLKGVLGFIGLTDVTVIRAEGLNLGEEPKATAIAQAKAQIEALAA